MSESLYKQPIMNLHTYTVVSFPG